MTSVNRRKVLLDVQDNWEKLCELPEWAQSKRPKLNEAASDVNKSLDGCTFPGLKMTGFAYHNNFLAGALRNILSSGTSYAT